MLVVLDLEPARLDLPLGPQPSPGHGLAVRARVLRGGRRLIRRHFLSLRRAWLISLLEGVVTG